LIDSHSRPYAFLALGLGLAFGALAAPAAIAQESPPAKDGGGEKAPPEKSPEEKKAEEVKAYIKQYEETLSKMTEPDAISGLNKLKAFYLDAQVPPESKKEIMKTFQGKVIRVKNKESYLEAACKALGEMGGDESVAQLKYLVSDALDKKVPVYKVARGGLESLGKIASPKPGDVKFLTDMMKKSEDDILGDVAQALKGYGKAPGAVRREIFEQVLLKAEGVYSKQNANDQNAKKQWTQWGTDAIDALKALSRTNFAKPPEFREWFNNKDKGGGKNPRTWADEPAEPSK
jgi:hypothetical protein